MEATDQLIIGARIAKRVLDLDADVIDVSDLSVADIEATLELSEYTGDGNALARAVLLNSATKRTI